MSNVIRFRLNENPTPGKVINFTIDISGLLTASDSVTFVNSVSNANTQCLIGSTILDTRNNLQSWATNYITNVRSVLLPYSTISAYIDITSQIVDINILYDVLFRYTFSPSRNPLNTESFSLDVKKNGSVYKSLNKTFNTSTNSSSLIIVGATVSQTLDNMLSNFNLYNTNTNISHSISTDNNSFGYKKLYLDVSDTSNNTFSLSVYSNNTGLNITGPIELPSDEVVSEYTIGGEINAQEIKVRSPYIYIRPYNSGSTCSTYLLINSSTQSALFTYTDCATGQLSSQVLAPSTNEYSFCAVENTVSGPSFSLISNCTGNAVDYSSIIYDIRSWKGDINTQTGELIQYNKEKLKVVNSQDTIFINLSNLFRYKLEGDISRYISIANPTQSQSIGYNESRWGYVSGDFVKNGQEVGRNFSTTFYILDGYTEPGEEQGLIKPFTPGWEQKILLTNNAKREYTYGSNVRIHFKREGLTSINVYPGGVFSATPSTIQITGTPSYSYDYIQSILVDTTQDMMYMFNYGSSGESVRTYITDYNCKYKPYDVIFKNKWGVLETLSFPLKSVNTLNTTEEKFLRGIVDYNGNYDVTRHTNKIYNLEMMEEVTLNTNFLPEYMNVVFKELMASEEIWVVDMFNNITPVNRSDAQFSYKTHVNDKLIQYTMKYKNSHNTINNIT